VDDWGIYAYFGTFDGHPVIEAWNHRGLFDEVVRFVQSAHSQWTSIDLVRIEHTEDSWKKLRKSTELGVLLTYIVV
jgi:hypothetical protein